MSGPGRPPGHRVWALVAAALVAVVAIVGIVVTRDDVDADPEAPPATRDGPSPTDRGLIERQELAAAEVTALDDELWIYGGVSGPDGSKPHPPYSGVMPEGLTANSTVAQYDSVGALRRHITLPDLSNRRLIGGQVVADGDERFLISNLCNGPSCSSTEPALYRLHESAPVRIPVDIPGQGDRSPGGTLPRPIAPVGRWRLTSSPSRRASGPGRWNAWPTTS